MERPSFLPYEHLASASEQELDENLSHMTKQGQEITSAGCWEWPEGNASQRRRLRRPLHQRPFKSNRIRKSQTSC